MTLFDARGASTGGLLLLRRYWLPTHLDLRFGTGGIYSLPSCDSPLTDFVTIQDFGKRTILYVQNFLNPVKLKVAQG